MTVSVPNYAACDGGLVLNSNKFELLRRPGVALRLRNFEVSLNGGYRRISGYAKFGGASATQPNGTNVVLGVVPYAGGAVACVGTEVFFTDDGITWIQVNRDTSESGSDETQLALDSELPRTNAGQTSFVIAKGTLDHATNPFGVLYIASGNDKVGHFHINGTGGSRTFHYTEISAPSTGEFLENHDHHLCIVDTTNNPNKIFYSANDDYDNFIGGTSGSVRLTDQIVGIKSFRDDLYIFCENSIHKLTNINDPARLEIVSVTGSLGCITGRSIQEIGGDLIFLAPDGFRSVAATERNDDIERSSVSRGIQPLINAVVEAKDSYTFSSVVLKEKNQYRFFYIDSSGVGNGFIGTLRTNSQGVTGFQWSEVRGNNVYSIETHFNTVGVEVTYQGGPLGFVFIHDSGSSFNGGNIEAEYQSPDTDLGDLGMRKTMHYLNLSLTPEGIVSLTLTLSFDFSSTRLTQPSNFTINIATAPAKYGTATYGNANYGAIAEPLERIPLQGSGSSLAYRFYTNDTNPSYTIQGFHTEIFPSGRK